MTDLTLRIAPRGAEPFTYKCEKDSIVIGRGSAADLAIQGDHFISREHARVFRKGDDWFIEDIRARNKTILNGRTLQEPTRLNIGDTILICDSVVRVGADVVAPLSEAPGPALSTESGVFKPAETIIAAAASERFEDTSGIRELRRQATRLKLLNDVHKALATSISLEDLLELILDRVFALLQPEEAAIYLAKDGNFERAMSRRLPHVRAEDSFHSTSLIRRVTERRETYLVNDAQSAFQGQQSVISSGVRNLLAAPLLHSKECPGMIVLSSAGLVREFTEEDRELLTSLASIAALQMRHIEHVEEAGRRRDLEKELALARRIQVALLPEAPPAVDGYDVFASNFPSRGVSGDLYRFEARPEKKECYVFVADVSGKGIAASLLTASLEALAAGPMEMGREPGDLFTKLSRRLYQRTPLEKYATAFVAVLHSEHGSVRYANAGHNPALVVRTSGEVEEVGASGVPLGILPESSYESGALSLSAGDSLVIYTDGITEAENPNGDEYEIDRLKAVCRRVRSERVEAMAAAIAEDLEAFADGTPYGDDRTLVIARRSC